MTMRRGGMARSGVVALAMSCALALGVPGLAMAQGAPAPGQVSVSQVTAAAQRGIARAQTYLGSLYAAGSGVTQDYAKAAHWYRQAAEQGDAVAQVNLGVLYENGQGVARNDAAAAHWFRKAAKQGNAEAQNDLAGLYQQGRGVPLDYAKAIHWYRQSAAQGNEAAHHNLMALYAYLKKTNQMPKDAE